MVYKEKACPRKAPHYSEIGCPELLGSEAQRHLCVQKEPGHPNKAYPDVTNRPANKTLMGSNGSCLGYESRREPWFSLVATTISTLISFPRRPKKVHSSNPNENHSSYELESKLFMRSLVAL